MNLIIVISYVLINRVNDDNGQFCGSIGPVIYVERVITCWLAILDEILKNPPEKEFMIGLEYLAFDPLLRSHYYGVMGTCSNVSCYLLHTHSVVWKCYIIHIDIYIF